MKKMNQIMKTTITFLQKHKGNFIVLAVTITLGACSPNENNPTPDGFSVTTATPSNITETTVTLGGNVTNDGGNTVTETGICLGETANPVINDPNGFTDAIGSGTGAFTQDYSGLEPNSTIHVRAYATNSTGTVYGEDKVFTTGAATACNVIQVTPTNITISTPTTWTTGNVYVVKGTVTVNSVLTIEPGVVVKLQNGFFTVNSTGKIIANGNASNKIIFTSLADDTHCGDSNGDGNATTPQKGDWVSVQLTGGTGNIFNYCDFLYAGSNSGGHNNAIYVSWASSTYTFDHCTFAHTKSGNNTLSIAFSGGYGITDNATQLFTNNVFYDNDIPMFSTAKYNVSTTNIFHNPSNPSETNLRNCIWLDNLSLGGFTGIWNVTEVPYVVTQYMQVFSPAALVIGANVKVKFSSSSYGLQRNNVNDITYQGTTTFTAYKDDAVGGDTNGDGNVTSPASGDWYGFRNNYGAFTFEHNSNIRYAAN